MNKAKNKTTIKPYIIIDTYTDTSINQIYDKQSAITYARWLNWNHNNRYIIQLQSLRIKRNLQSLIDTGIITYDEINIIIKDLKGV